MSLHIKLSVRAAWKRDRRTVLWLSAFCLLYTSSCVSVQWRDSDGRLRSLGLVQTDTIDTGQAKVVVQRSAGLNVRLTSFDGGVTVGYRKQIGVQPCAPKSCSPGHATGLFWTTSDDSPADGFFLRQAVGADIGFDTFQNGFRLGFNKQIIIFGPRADESVTAKVIFNEDHLEQTIYLEER
jgi:hypothetical protein